MGSEKVAWGCRMEIKTTSMQLTSAIAVQSIGRRGKYGVSHYLPLGRYPRGVVKLRLAPLYFFQQLRSRYVEDV